MTSWTAQGIKSTIAHLS